MTLKEKISDTEFEALDGLQAAYKKDGDFYVVDLEIAKSAGTVDELGEIKRALARVRVEKKELAERVTAFEKTSNDDNKTTAIKEQDLEKLTKAHDDERAIDKGILSGRDAFIKKQLIDAVVKSTALKLSGKKNEKAMTPHVRSRLSVDFSGSEPELQFLDKDGRAGMTLENLEKELLDTGYLADILLGSKAVGSGTTGDETADGAPQGKTFDELNSAEKVALRAKNPAEYERLKSLCPRFK